MMLDSSCLKDEQTDFANNSNTDASRSKDATRGSWP